jgi:hypothetical protein
MAQIKDSTHKTDTMEVRSNAAAHAVVNYSNNNKERKVKKSNMYEVYDLVV